MTSIRRFGSALPAVLLLASLWVAGAQPEPAQARSAALGQGQVVHVNVSFNTQMFMQEIDEKTLVDKQQQGRKFMYMMASKECAILKETIAETCRLTKLNVSAQLREQSGQNPLKLYINGNAQFVIKLKDSQAQ